MKKIIFSAMLVLTTTISFVEGQESTPSSDHLTFKGVPIDGTLNEYVLKMKNNGFTQLGTEEGTAMLKGDFAGHKDCIVGVATLKQKDLVSKITVIFPRCDTWSTLSSNYFSLKELLIEKYGKPSDSFENFDGIEPSDDNFRIHQVKFDNCKYYTTFKTEKGSIQLSIEHDGVLSCFVILTYNDKINGDSIRAKALDEL
jgi:hypothetical protein